jgi:single-strand DNA-binding protein
MLNRFVAVGRLTKDPELKYTPNGIAVANFTLAVNRPFSNGQGEREADYIQCVVWRKPAENVANFLKKGSLAGIDGRLQTRHYENSQGHRVYITEVLCESVQFLEPKSSRSNSQNNNQYNNQQQNQGFNNQQNRNSFNNDPFANDGNPVDISDDDLPF